MPVAIACPNCQTKYSIQEALLGRQVKCRECGSVFETQAPKIATPQQSATTTPNRITGSSQVGGPSDQELAAAGLTGTIAGSQALFEARPTSGMDPLGNHVVQDPGFGQSKFRAKKEEPTSEDVGYREVLNNQALNQPKKAKKKKDPLAEYLTPEEIAGKEVNIYKEREKEEPYGGVATTMYWVGGMMIVLNLLDYLAFTREVEDLGLMEDAKETLTFYKGLFCGLFGGAGFLVLVLGALVPYIPIIAISLGLLIYVSVCGAQYSYIGVDSIRGVVLDVLISLAFIYGLYAAIMTKYYGKDPSLEPEPVKKK